MSASPDLQRALEAGRRNDAVRVLDAIDDRDGVDEALDVLAAAAGRGDTLATELLVEQLQSRGVVRAAVRRYLFDEAAVDDVAQDTLLSVASGVRRFRGDARCTTWVFTIARNRVTDHLRRARATSPLEDDVSESVRMSSLIASRAAVQQIVAQLPDLYRDAVRLRDVEGLDYDEVADRLGSNENTVRSRVTRGRALIAARLGDGDTT